MTRTRDLTTWTRTQHCFFSCAPLPSPYCSPFQFLTSAYLSTDCPPKNYNRNFESPFRPNFDRKETHATLNSTLLLIGSRRCLCRTWMKGTSQGRIQDFHLGGGGAQKIMCLHAHYERKTKLTFGRGPGPA